jgi:hypothetical protein
LKALKLASTYIIPYNTINKILHDPSSRLLDQFNSVNIHKYDFVVGPHLVLNNHWIAFIINRKSKHFFLIDPFGIDSDNLKNNFEAWVQYYKMRSDSKIPFSAPTPLPFTFTFLYSMFAWLIRSVSSIIALSLKFLSRTRSLWLYSMHCEHLCMIGVYSSIKLKLKKTNSAFKYLP